MPNIGKFYYTDMEREDFMEKIRRILGFFALLLFVTFSTKSFANNYTCDYESKYMSCVPGYYLSECGSEFDGRTLSESDLTVGNTCTQCPDGYICDGTMKCPTLPSCEPGFYANNGSCTTCPDGAVCPGGTDAPAYRVDIIVNDDRVAQPEHPYFYRSATAGLCYEGENCTAANKDNNDIVFANIEELSAQNGDENSYACLYDNCSAATLPESMIPTGEFNWWADSSYYPDRYETNTGLRFLAQDNDILYNPALYDGTNNYTQIVFVSDVISECSDEGEYL